MTAENLNSKQVNVTWKASLLFGFNSALYWKTPKIYFKKDLQYNM